MVKFIAGDDCGCNERQEKLNKLFPYNRQPQCLNESEYNQWSELRVYLSGGDKVNLSKEQLDIISNIYSRVFQTRSKYRPCTCNPRAWNDMIQKIELLYSTYE